jgi:hypothetical protein
MPYTGRESIAKFLSPEAYCFLLDVDEGTNNRLEFQLMPENISESKAAIYNEIPIIGRSLPLLGYAGSTSRQVSLSINFAAINKPGSGKYDVFWVQNRVRWLESKVYPVYRGGFTFPPHRLLLILGQAIRMQAVMVSCTTSWLGPWDAMIENENNAGQVYPFRASIDCQFQEYGLNNGASGHPHGHYDAISGRNQADADSGAESYIDIPIAAQAETTVPDFVQQRRDLGL